MMAPVDLLLSVELFFPAPSSLTSPDRGVCPGESPQADSDMVMDINAMSKSLLTTIFPYLNLSSPSLKPPTSTPQHNDDRDAIEVSALHGL